MSDTCTATTASVVPAARLFDSHGREANLPEVAAAVQAHSRFLVTSHARPDGDAIGSALACAEILEHLGKSCDIVLADAVPQVYHTLPGAARVQQETFVDAARWDCAIVLECDSIARTGLQGLGSLPLLNIDHHMTGCNYGALNWIDESVSAVAIMVYRLARALGVPISPAMATCLYTALLTDTGAFTYPGTATGSLPVAQELIAHGADADRIARDVFYTASSSHVRLLGTALSRMQVHGATAWSFVTQQDLSNLGATDEDGEGTVDYLLSIAGVDAALFLREMPQEPGQSQQFRISLRSKTSLDVSALAAEHGGGGHQRSAGCSVLGPLEAAVAVMLHGLEQLRGVTSAA